MECKGGTSLLEGCKHKSIVLGYTPKWVADGAGTLAGNRGWLIQPGRALRRPARHEAGGAAAAFEARRSLPPAAACC